MRRYRRGFRCDDPGKKGQDHRIYGYDERALRELRLLIFLVVSPSGGQGCRSESFDAVDVVPARNRVDYRFTGKTCSSWGKSPEGLWKHQPEKAGRADGQDQAALPALRSRSVLQFCLAEPRAEPPAAPGASSPSGQQATREPFAKPTRMPIPIQRVRMSVPVQRPRRHTQ